MQRAAQPQQEFERWSSPWLQNEGYSLSWIETQASFAWGATIAGGKEPHQVTMETDSPSFCSHHDMRSGNYGGGSQ